MSLWRHLWWTRVYFNVGKSYYTPCIENKQLKGEKKKLNVNEDENENEKFKENKMVKDANIKELIEKPKEIKSPNWLDKNKFKEILTIINSNKFGRKNKIAVSKFSEIDAKKHLNTLNKIKNAEIKHKRLIPGQKDIQRFVRYNFNW